MSTTPLSRAARGSRRRPAVLRRDCPRRRRGISVVLVVIVLVVLIGFASLAVDVGRVRVVKVQLQTAADAAATAAASGMERFPQRGVLESQDRAVEAAAANFSLDQRDADGERKDSSIELIPDEDMMFGRWNDVTGEFVELEQVNGGIDERRQANAIRVFARRVTSFIDKDGNAVERGTGVPLILTPVLPGGPFTGEVQARATATLNGHVETAAFVGLDDVRFTGATRSDSYSAATENYPGAGGPNRNTSIASNGDITFSGAAQILGSVYPGKNMKILPESSGALRGNLDITGHMFQLTRPLTAVTPAFTPPTDPNQYNIPTTIDPRNALRDTDQSFNAANNQVTTLYSRNQANPGESSKFYFSSWTSRSNDEVHIDNSLSPVEIWISGDLQSTNSAKIVLISRLHPVTFHINGNADFLGGGVVHQGGALPANLRILMSGPGTTLRIGGAQPMSAHVTAPSSSISFTGNGSGSYHFFGRAVGRTLTVSSNVELHYDESLGLLNPLFAIRLVE